MRSSLVYYADDKQYEQLEAKLKVIRFALCPFVVFDSIIAGLSIGACFGGSPKARSFSSPPANQVIL